jgi:uridine kinase
MERPLIIGIAGGTGSGKTTIAAAIQQELRENITFITQDAYYRSFSDMPWEERNQINFDHPDSFDNELLVRHLQALKNGLPIYMPVYDFKSHLRSEDTILKRPAKIIIVEGILIFADEVLREEFDIRIFVDTDADIRILRRIERDIKDRGRSLDSILHQYRTTVRPMHIEFVEPTKRFADVIIPEGGHNLVGIDMIVGKLKSILTISQA